MNIRKLGIALTSALAISQAIAPPAAIAGEQRIEGDREAFVAWAKAAAVPVATTVPGAGLDDLSALERIVGDARVVGVGESFHGGNEFFGLRHRTARYLVERMGFDAIALESGLPEGRLVHDYVLGGEEPEGLWEVGFTWTMADFPATRELVEWIRAFNQRTGRQVRFYGMDVAGARGTWIPAVEQVFDYLNQVEPQWGAEMRERLVPLLEKFDRPGRDAGAFTAANDAFAALPQDDRSAVSAYVNELVDRLENLELSYLRKASADDYDWAHRVALNLRAAVNLVVSYEAKDRPNPVWNARDAVMATNVEWMLRQGGPDSRVVVLAHNAHVQGATASIAHPYMASAGMFLRERLGRAYRTIGFTFGSGTMPVPGASEAAPLPDAEPDSIDGALAAIGLPLALVDLQRLPLGSAAARWLSVPRTLRFMSQYVPYDQLRSWDALFYVAQASASVHRPH